MLEVEAALRLGRDLDPRASCSYRKRRHRFLTPLCRSLKWWRPDRLLGSDALAQMADLQNYGARVQAEPAGLGRVELQI